MPNGYLVTLGDNSLDVNDTIDATQIFFTIASTIGAGGWQWTGVWDGNGSTYFNIPDSGTFYEGTDGNVYFVPDTWYTTSGSAFVTSGPSYTSSGAVDGTSGADTIDASYTDSDGDQVDAGDGSGALGHEDTISAGDGNDSVDAGAENDLVYGGGGSDTLEGGAGNDTLYGDTDVIAPGGIAGNDSISGGAGSDEIYGEDGADTLLGNGGNDTLFGGDGADSIAGGSGADQILGGEGNDSISGGNGNDTIIGGEGADSIDGNDGDDFIGVAPVSDSTTLDWNSVGANGTFAMAGASETLNVTVSTTTNGAGQTANTNSYGSPSADALWVSGITQAITTTMTFDSPVENANFEIYDLDQNAGSWDDLITIIALDSEGNQVTVNFSDLDGLHSVDGDTLNADGMASGGVETTGADDSVTVSIPGPFVQLSFTFDNGESATNSGLFGVGNMTLDFTTNLDEEPGDDTINGDDGNDTIYAGSGNDSISGGAGADEMYGQDGDDVFNVGEGDSAYGGDGDDYFTLVDLGETVGAGNNIFIQGDETGETAGDTLNLGGLGSASDIVFSNSDDALGGLSGTLVLDDGTVLTFENIERIICFTLGTLIDTPFGPRAIETLKAGDLVNTRDAGAQQIRWMGARTLPCTAKTAPIHFDLGALEGQTHPLTVSPQHKMLITHFASELLFGESQVFCSAKHMLGGAITQSSQKMVTYVHLMLDSHQVITANGVETESFHAGPEGLKALSQASKEDLFRAFPALKEDPYAHGRTAHPCLKSNETRLLMDEIAHADAWRATQLAA
ncbi:Hint domain-containing protein [Planktotalea sp.]|uniref:Hint domain-containing protein n=1 Tax=Planktotalea sp. TaxID=2029877 RepID=UPI003D6C65FB